MTEIDDALNREPGAVAAFHHKGTRSWLGIYRVGAAGAALLAHVEMPTAERQQREKDLRERGIRIGTTDGEYVWIVEASSFKLWTAERVVTESGFGDLTLLGKRIAGAEIEAVVSFVDRSNLGHRGVFIQVKRRGAILVVDEHDPAAEADPAYSINNASLDGAWALRLAADLGAWLRVPVRRDSAPPATNPPPR